MHTLNRPKNTPFAHFCDAFRRLGGRFMQFADSSGDAAAAVRHAPAGRSLASCRLLILVLLSSAACSLLPLHAQGYHTVWHTHTTQNGLPSSSVNCIYEDSRGMMWFGTWDGLCRYDGSQKVVYRHVTADERSISHQVVRHICEDGSGHLWVTTDMGINRLDLETGSFARYYLDYAYNYVLRERAFCCDAAPDGTVVGACLGGQLQVYDAQRETFAPALTEGSFPSSIDQLFFAADGTLWVRSADALLAVARRGTAYRVSRRIALPSSSALLFYDGRDAVWYQNGGTLWHIDVKTKRRTDSHIAVPGTLNAVRHLSDSRGRQTVVCTTSGAYRITPDGLEPLTTARMSVLSVAQNAQGIVWFGTDGRGIMERYDERDFVQHYPLDQIMADAFFPVRAILRLDGRLYVGSKGGGLVVKSGSPASQDGVPVVLPSSSVLSLAAWHGRVLVGTDGEGMFVLDPATLTVEPLVCPDGTTTQAFGAVYSILVKSEPSATKRGRGVLQETIYVGTSGNGLYRLRTRGGSEVVAVSNFRHAPNNAHSISSDIIYSLQADDHWLWMATRGGGLCRMDRTTDTFEAFMANANVRASLPTNDVIALRLDDRGLLWVGTTEGVAVCEGGEPFSILNHRQGLPGDNVHAILQARDGHIWVSTSQGIASIDRRNFHVTPYSLSYGGLAIDNEYADGAAFADAGGDLFFGGTGGIAVITPHLMVAQHFMPRLLLTEHDGRSAIHCRYNEPLTLNFSILDFKANARCAFEYCLATRTLSPEELEGRWMAPGEGRELVFNNLSPGTYRLYARCSNSENVWCDPLAYTIRVAPPWWRSWWAYAAYIVAIGAAVRSFYRYKRRRLIAIHRHEMERERQVSKEVAHQAKLRFFTNIAHEYSHSITLIHRAVDQIISLGTHPPRVQRQLMTIYSNAERMHLQIQDLMDFRKVETGHLDLQVSRFAVADLVLATADSFLDATEQRGIDLRVTVMPDIGQWVTDRGNVERIVFNLLSSAVNHAPDGGRVTLLAERRDATAGEDQRMLVITCSNDGPGIPPERLPYVFNRMSALEDFEEKISSGIEAPGGVRMALCHDLAELMQGDITVESEPGVITTFTLTLPMLEAPQGASDWDSPSSWQGQGERPGREDMSDEDRQFMARAVEVVRQHYAEEDFNKDVWASELAMSRMQLYRRLRDIVGVPPSTFIRSYRMQQAAERLIHSSLNVQEIAFAVGYRNRSNFHRAFQQEYGCAPLEYRASKT